eukprot:CAMPEP_0184310576 /NCGR_PEP_ID=MMETSP1049-20130417/31155_1 /TAXON_ID=77928 /ORGANISM="Proteomonas sulcata, Strain CCMP704" /LENGTH=187 /DNA_ID=CAMNT_0026624903 /DNA_START=168 /DNA_END=732 /DNA_ORIENTATION=-
MVDRLSAGQLKELHTSFTLLDGDGDGRIDAVDLQKFLGTFNANFSLHELEEFINDETCHPHGVQPLILLLILAQRYRKFGCVAGSGFPGVCQHALAAHQFISEYALGNDEDTLRATFEAWDEDGDGMISANDLRNVVEMCGEEWSDENVNDMIYHRKTNGLFSLEDLRAIISGARASRQSSRTSTAK